MQDEHDTQQTDTDDVEGHAYKSGRGPAEAADVEAHAIRSGRGPAEAADVEAHQVRSGRGPAEAAEVSAHATRGRGRNDDAEPPEGEERLAVPDADDDVEGHAYRSGR